MTEFPEAGARPPTGATAESEAGRTLGPVPDLERHLPREWWNGLFRALYLRTDGDVVENDVNSRQDVDILIGAAGLATDDRILDLCCGQGRHSLELARRGYRYVTGLDRSRYLVRLARRRARKQGLDVSFREGDARKFRLGDSKFDCVTILGNSFGYFEREEDDLRVLAAVSRALRSGGTLVMDLADGDWLRANFEQRSWEWIDQNQFVCRERSVSSDGGRLISREVVVDADKGVVADQFYAERLYSRAAVEHLLASAGFGGLRFHDTTPPLSDRNQDLGMLARRMYITCAAPNKAAASPRRKRTREVTVLLGDPRLPDPVKLAGRFGDEDLATVKRLKDALAELEGYSFRYLDNHATLLQDLRKDPPELVLNLCDEGFNNDAFLELSVPSYLDMLGVPYTGAGPSCLGICYDKSLVRAVADGVDVPVPRETFLHPDDLAGTIPSIFPALIKPALGDSSIGITQHAVVRTPEQAVAYVAALRRTLPGRAALVQEFLSGPEYSVAILGNPETGFHSYPVLEVDYSGLPPELPHILSYESKWQPDSPFWTDIRYLETDASEDTCRMMIDYSTRLFTVLGCRDYARFDFREDGEGQIKLLEVNPNPGWCWDGKLNLMAGFAGLRYADLLRQILSAARARLEVRLSRTYADHPDERPEATA